MARTKRGFILQQFLPGGITPSAKPGAKTGAAPATPAAGFVGSPVEKRQAATSQGYQVANPGVGYGQNLNAYQPTVKYSLPGVGAATAAATGNKFADLQKAFGDISLGGFGGMSANAGSLLGGSAAATDWKKLFGYQGMGQSTIQNALKAFGISAAQGGWGTSGLYDDQWLKKVGLA